MAIKLTTSWQDLSYAALGSYNYVYLQGKYIGQDKTNNKTTVQFRLKNVGKYSASSWSSSNAKAYFSGAYSTGDNYFDVSGSYSNGSIICTKPDDGKPIQHNGDGTKTITEGAKVTAVTKSGTLTANIPSVSITLPTIPRENSIATPSEADIGNTINIVIGNNSTSFRNTVTWTYNGVTQTVIDVNETTLDKVASGTYQWTIPTSIYSTIPNSKQATITFTNTTYSGSTPIGDPTTSTVKANVPSSSKPTLSLTSKVETNQDVISAIPSSETDFTKPIINMSKPSFTFTATAYNSATLSLLTVTKDGDTVKTVPLSGTTQSVTYTFQNSMTTPTVTFDVTDSRGLTMAVPYTFDGTSTAFTYEAPVFKEVEIERPTILASIVNADVSGTYTVKKLDGTTDNEISVGFDSREIDGEYSGNIEWYDSSTPNSSVVLDKTNGTWSFNDVLAQKYAEYNKSYYFKVYVNDEVSSTPRDFAFMVRKSVPTFSAGESDFQINGELYLADEDGANAVEMFDLTGTPRYDDTESYVVGDYCVYDDSLYKCIANTTGTFDSNSWSATDIMTEIGSGGGGGGGTTNYNDLSNKPSINNVSLVGNKTTSDLGINIPTKVSDLTNDSGYVTSSYHDSTKQDTLVSGTSLKTINSTSLLGSGDITVSTFSGSYNDLTNKPTIPTNTSDLTNDSGFIEATSFELSDILAITTQSNLYYEIEGAIANDLPFSIKESGADGTALYPVIYAQTGKHYVRIDYKDDVDQIVTIEITGSLNKTVTQSLKPIQTKEVFSLSSILAITSTSDSLYTAVTDCIKDQLAFRVYENNKKTYEVIRVYEDKVHDTYSFEYIDLDNNIQKINIVPVAGVVTVTQTSVGIQEEITNANKLDYSLLSNTPTIPTALSDLTDDSTHRLVTDTNKTTWSGKQDALVSGTNIKTINNQSLLGSGNITIQGGGGGTATDVQINGSSIVSNDVANLSVEGTYNSSTNKIATMSEVPTNTSDLTNDGDGNSYFPYYAVAHYQGNGIQVERLSNLRWWVGAIHNYANACRLATEEDTGDLSTLSTTDKDNLVDAINEVNTNNAYGVLLFESSTGTDGSVLLADSSANYRYIEIFYKSNDGDYSSVKVYEPNGKTVALLVQRATTGTPRVYGKTRTVEINGSNITNVANSTSQYTINNGATGYVQVQDYILITRVVGYTNATIPSEINYDVSDTGWQSLTTSKGTWTLLKYRKIGNIVNVVGHASAYTWSGSSGDTIVTAANGLPAGCRPVSNIYFNANVSGTRLARGYIGTGGNIGIDWVANISNGSNYTSSTWLNFNITYITS